MPFEKGHKKIGGRKKGSENKDKKKIREFIGTYLDENTSKLELELNKLEGRDYINAVTGLLEYSIPKLSRADLSSSDGTMSPKLNVIVQDKETSKELIKLGSTNND